MGRKFDDWKQARRYSLKKKWQWCVDNPELAVTIATIAVSVLGGAAKCLLPKINSNMEQKALRSRLYDPQNGGYLYTRKPMSTSQMVELDRRRRAGQSVTQALDEMNVLKRR